MAMGIIPMIYPIYDTKMRIDDLLKRCDGAERELIEQMIHNAADYVRAVIIMETAASNITERDLEEAREIRQSTDRARSVAHDAFISSVNVVNRICDAHKIRKLYDGAEDRREYGDFAMRLVSDIFSKRQ